MDKIFREIKKAIEEEMRNAESGPSPGGGRSQGGGGRRAQEYAEWLKEEQDRLRGDRQQQVYQPEKLEQVPVEAREAEVQQRRSGERPPRSGQGQRQQRDRSQRGPRPQERPQGSRRQQHEAQSQPRSEWSANQQQQRRQGQERQRRQQQQRSQPQSAADLRHRVERQLRSPGGLRQAFLMREIVSKPVSLRDKDDHLIA